MSQGMMRKVLPYPQEVNVGIIGKDFDCMDQALQRHIHGDAWPYAEFADPTEELADSPFGYNEDGPYYRQRCEILLNTETPNLFWRGAYTFAPSIYLPFAQVVIIMLDDSHQDSMQFLDTVYENLPLPPRISDVARKEACIKCGQTQNTDGCCPHPGNQGIAPLAEIIAFNLGIKPNQRVKELHCDDLRQLMLIPMDRQPVVIVRMKSEGTTYVKQEDIDRFVYDRQYCSYGGSFTPNNIEEIKHALWTAILLYDGMRIKAGEAALLSNLRVARPEMAQRATRSLPAQKTDSVSVTRRLGRVMKRCFVQADPRVN